MMDRNTIIILAVALLSGLGISYVLRTSQGKPIVTVIAPAALTAIEASGKTLFVANCAQCHGQMAGGSENGPPLVHVIYEPNHHDNASFYQAARNGVRAHHWQYGDMPPVTTVSQPDVTEIISYVRALQRANGIN